MRRGGDGHHVVQRHHRIRDQDGPNRAPHVGFRRNAAAMGFALGHDELDPDVQEQQPAHHLEIGNLQQCRDDQAEGDAQGDGRRASADDGDFSLRLGQRAGRESDHHGVIAGQQDIDARDS